MRTTTIGLTIDVPWIPGGVLILKPPTTNRNHRISRSGVFFPASLAQTGMSLEDFELYGSLRGKGQHCFLLLEELKVESVGLVLTPGILRHGIQVVQDCQLEQGLSVMMGPGVLTLVYIM